MGHANFLLWSLTMAALGPKVHLATPNKRKGLAGWKEKATLLFYFQAESLCGKNLFLSLLCKMPKRSSWDVLKKTPSLPSQYNLRIIDPNSKHMRTSLVSQCMFRFFFAMGISNIWHTIEPNGNNSYWKGHINFLAQKKPRRYFIGYWLLIYRSLQKFFFFSFFFREKNIVNRL